MVMLVPDLRPDSSVVAEVRPSPNHNERKGGARPDMILLHYTGMRDVQAAVSVLCSPASEVSAHYVVLEDGHIIQLVAEERRAWHAGVSFWAGETDINSCSIGIEIANPGHDQGYPDFPKRQVDVAPARKQDPGEKFPWRLLANSGIGMWVKPTPTSEGNRIYMPGETDPAIEAAQRLLAKYGYGVNATGHLDATTRDTVIAFQRHFRPSRIDGVLDPSTLTTLKALIEARDAKLSTLQPS